MKKILTVLGPVEPTELGITLAHEHVLIDLRCHFEERPDASAQQLKNAPVATALLAALARRPFSTTRDNLILSDEAVAISELGEYVKEGGSALVDCTCIGIGRDPRALFRIARATGLHIVMGSGCYVEHAHPDWVREADVEELTERFTTDVLVGVDGSGIRSGVIGEVGTGGVPKGTWEKQGNITKEEEKVLRAAGRAAVRTGVAVTVHVDSRGQGGFEVMDILASEGLAPHRMILGHLDLVEDLEYHSKLAERGAYVQYDNVGRESYVEEYGRPWGHDTWRVEAISRLVAAGFGPQILVSQDIALKTDLQQNGGIGYSHILKSTLPMFRRAGVSEAALHGILVENPARALSVEWPIAGAPTPDVRQTDSAKARR